MIQDLRRATGIQISQSFVVIGGNRLNHVLTHSRQIYKTSNSDMICDLICQCPPQLLRTNQKDLTYFYRLKTISNIYMYTCTYKQKLKRYGILT